MPIIAAAHSLPAVSGFPLYPSNSVLFARLRKIFHNPDRERLTQAASNHRIIIEVSTTLLKPGKRAIGNWQKKHEGE